MRAKIILLTFIMAIGCARIVPVPEMPRTHDHAGRGIKVTVYTYKTYGAMNREYQNRLVEKGESVVSLSRSMQGWSEWTVNVNPPECEVHVLEPVSAGDRENMKVWGHELMHCVYGKFHKEGRKYE